MQDFQLDWSFVATIAAPILALITGYTLDRYFGRKPKVIAYIGHVANFVVRRQNDDQPQQPDAPDQLDQPIFAHSLVVTNAGREVAKNVRLGHHALPPDYVVVPDIEYDKETTPGGGVELRFPTLVPKEQITISYLYFKPVQVGQIHSYIKSDDGLAKIIRVIPQQELPRWVTYISASLSVVGIIALLYALSAIIR